MIEAERTALQKAAYRKWRSAHLEQERARVRKYNATNKERRKERDKKNAAHLHARWREWYDRNRQELLGKQKVGLGREKNREACRKYRAMNPEKRRHSQESYRKRYPWKHAEKQRRRTASMIRATPPWSSIAEMQAIYESARRRQEETGIRMHVDHIVPLKASKVCGLHVPWNLQVLPAVENIRKGNRQ